MNLPVMHPTSAVDGLFLCRNRFGVNPGRCFSNVDCVKGLNGEWAPHCDVDNIECSCRSEKEVMMKIAFEKQTKILKSTSNRTYKTILKSHRNGGKLCNRNLETLLNGLCVILDCFVFL